MVLAFLPQHVWEVGATFLAVVLVGQGLVYLIRGTGPPETAGMSPRAIRLVSYLSVLLGVGLGIAAFAVDAEPPGVHNTDHWGGTTGVVLLGVWMAFLVSIIRRRARRR
jgi:hypothetical protein